MADATRFKQLLVINEYPPSTVAGAPVIARQLLDRYDPERLDVLCSGAWYDNATPTVRETFLPCRHTSVRHSRHRQAAARLRPLESTWIACVPQIMGSVAVSWKSAEWRRCSPPPRRGDAARRLLLAK